MQLSEDDTSLFAKISSFGYLHLWFKKNRDNELQISIGCFRYKKTIEFEESIYLDFGFYIRQLLDICEGLPIGNISIAVI